MQEQLGRWRLRRRARIHLIPEGLKNGLLVSAQICYVLRRAQQLIAFVGWPPVPTPAPIKLVPKAPSSNLNPYYPGPWHNSARYFSIGVAIETRS
jgi:hypothetical protein